MELINDYHVLIAGKIYEFNLDLLTKNLTLKVSKQIYDPKKVYIAEENKRIVLRYYELRLIGIKKLNFDSLPPAPSSGPSLEDIEVCKIKDNEYKVGMDIVASDLEIICEKVELKELFENEMERGKAFRF